MDVRSPIRAQSTNSMPSLIVAWVLASTRVIDADALIEETDVRSVASPTPTDTDLVDSIRRRLPLALRRRTPAPRPSSSRPCTADGHAKGGIRHFASGDRRRGTAGWMTAAALASLRSRAAADTPDRIERIGIVGVGGSDAAAHPFLNQRIGIDERELMARPRRRSSCTEFVDWARIGDRYSILGTYGLAHRGVPFIITARSSAAGTHGHCDYSLPMWRRAQQVRIASEDPLM